MRASWICGAATVLITMGSAANAGVVCASLPTMEACIKCGAKKYGREAQVRHCEANWRPGRKTEQISHEEAVRRFGR